MLNILHAYLKCLKWPLLQLYNCLVHILLYFYNTCLFYNSVAYLGLKVYYLYNYQCQTKTFNIVGEKNIYPDRYCTLFKKIFIGMCGFIRPFYLHGTFPLHKKGKTFP